MRESIVIARQFKRFRKQFHFTQKELAELLGKSWNFVLDVEKQNVKRIHPKTYRLFLALKERYESERRNKNVIRRSNPASGSVWS